uniref:Leukemia inhibitory factor n=2 Tax=Ornithorhynchus anatinus TaxID=9258 RepID=F7EY27_ORNAN
CKLLVETGIVPLLLVLQWKPGSCTPLPVTPTNSMCANRHLCQNVTHQIRSQLNQLNSSAQGLFVLYYTTQGEPFQSKHDKLCAPNVTDFPPFHPSRQKKERFIELYRIVVYLNASLGNVSLDQARLNPGALSLRGNLTVTTAILRGLLNNLTCQLCNRFQVFHVDVTYGSYSREKDQFEKRKLGCQLLGKYKEVIAKVVQGL